MYQEVVANNSMNWGFTRIKLINSSKENPKVWVLSTHPKCRFHTAWIVSHSHRAWMDDSGSLSQSLHLSIMHLKLKVLVHNLRTSIVPLEIFLFTLLDNLVIYNFILQIKMLRYHYEYDNRWILLYGISPSSFILYILKIPSFFFLFGIYLLSN